MEAFNSTIGNSDPVKDHCKCCCKSCHLQTAAMVVGLIELVFCILQLYGLVHNWTIFGSNYVFWFLVGLFGVVLFLVVIIMLLYAIRMRTSLWIIPHLSLQVFLIIILLATVIVVFLLLALEQFEGIRKLLGGGQYLISDEKTINLGIGIVLIYLSVALLEMVFFSIIYKFYRFLRFEEVNQTNRNRLIVSSTNKFGQGFYPDDQALSNTMQFPEHSSLNQHGSPEDGDIYPYGNRY